MENTARKILVLLDITAPHHDAVGAAARLAQQERASVELYDCGITQALPPSWADEIHLLEQYRVLLRERRLDDLERLARPLRSCGIQVTTVAEDRAPLDEAIAQHIEQAAPDLIVKDATVAGSDTGSWQLRTDGILRRHARCPVLLVGEAPLADNAAGAPQPVDKEMA